VWSRRGKMKRDKPDYHLPIAGSAWSSSVELGAGIYFLEGRTHVAGHSSAAERALLERGAFLIASLRFDREILERSHASRSVPVLDVREAMYRFPRPPLLS
jgi:hypothetical protein